MPASVTAQQIRGKLHRTLQASRGKDLSSDQAIEAFLDGELPFSLKGGYGSNTPCVEIAAGGQEYVLCDAGTGLRDFGLSLLQSGRGGTPAVFHLFLSHLHWDHLQGFPFFLPAYRPGNAIHVYGGHADLETALRRQQEPPSFPVPFSALGARILFHTLEEGQTCRVAGLEVETIRQNHPDGSFGYRFCQGGKRVVYSTDMEHGAQAQAEDYPFVAFFQEADLLIFDAQYSLAEAIGVKETWGHSSNLIAVELAVRAKAKRLCLFHSEPTWDDETLDRFLEETRAYLKIHAPEAALTVDLAWDGLEIRC